MFTPARAAISRVDAPVKPRAAKTSSAAERMRALVEPGASRAFSRAVLVTMTGCLERLTTPRQAFAHDMAVELAYPSAHTRAGGVVDLTLHRRADVALRASPRGIERLHQSARTLAAEGVHVGLSRS